jgi:hypothetical protein
MAVIVPKRSPIHRTLTGRSRVERLQGATGFPYTELPAADTRIHRETMHVATVIPHTVRALDTGVRYTGRPRNYLKSGQIGAANCTKLSSKKDQQQMTFFGGREWTR